MKRIAALLFALVIVVTCFSFCANADSESTSGTYNGYNYYCSATLVSDTLSLELYYYNNTTTTIKIKGSYNYWTSGRSMQTVILNYSGKTAINRNPVPPNFDHFSSASPEFYLGSHYITSFSLSV